MGALQKSELANRIADNIKFNNHYDRNGLVRDLMKLREFSLKLIIENQEYIIEENKKLCIKVEV